MYIIARIFNLLWQCLLQFCHTRLLVNSCTSSHFSPYPIPTFEFSRTKCSAEIQTESMPLRTLNRGGVGLWKIHDRSIPCRWCYRPRNFIEFGTKLSDILLGKFAISVSWFWSWSWWKVNLFVPFLKISSTAVLFGVILCPHKQTESKHCTTSFLCFALNEYAADCRSIAFVTVVCGRFTAESLTSRRHFHNGGRRLAANGRREQPAGWHVHGGARHLVLREQALLSGRWRRQTREDECRRPLLGCCHFRR